MDQRRKTYTANGATTNYMNKKQTKHCDTITRDFAKSLRLKYKKGAKEHGGNLWDNKHLLDEALNEVVDLYSYLHTLRHKVQ